MSRLGRGAWWLAVAVACGGCTLVRVEQGTPLTVRDARRIDVGDSKAQVLARLGAPTQMFPVPGGSFFVYSFATTDSRSLEVAAVQASASWDSVERLRDRLYVRFDRDGAVTEIGHPTGLRSALR